MCCVKWVGGVAQSAAEVGLVRELHKLNSYNGLMVLLLQENLWLVDPTAVLVGALEPKAVRACLCQIVTPVQH